MLSPKGARHQNPERSPCPAIQRRPTTGSATCAESLDGGREHDHTQTNPAAGVKQVKEKREHRMPDLEVFRRVQAYAEACGNLGPREKGALPSYLWAAMELAYQARLRGIEVLTLTDAHDLDSGLNTNRRKGSRDNLVRKGEQLARAINSLRERRQQIWLQRSRPVPSLAEDRYLLVGEDGEPLTTSGFQTSWQRMMRNAIAAGVLTTEQRFALHGLKHRGVTDTQGDKRQASGHKTDAMRYLYDHDLPWSIPPETISALSLVSLTRLQIESDGHLKDEFADRSKSDSRGCRHASSAAAHAVHQSRQQVQAPDREVKRSQKLAG